jgi:hypothetical protein
MTQQAVVVFDEETQEYCLMFEEGILEALGFNEGDVVEWVDNEDGTFSINRVSHG